MPKHVHKVIAEIVARTGGFVSIKDTIAQVRYVISTSKSDADLQNEIGTEAAYQGKPILFDRL